MPAPLGPTTQRDLTGGDRERDVVNHRVVRVARRDAVDHAARGSVALADKVGPSHLGIGAHSAISPCIRTRPWARTITGLHRRSTRPSSCSISTTVMPLVAQLLDQRLDRRRERPAHAGHRLVQQEQPRLGHHRASDLDEPLLAAAQLAGVGVGVGAEIESCEQSLAPARPARASARRQCPPSDERRRAAARRATAARRAGGSRAPSSGRTRSRSGTCG